MSSCSNVSEQKPNVGLNNGSNHQHQQLLPASHQNKTITACVPLQLTLKLFGDEADRFPDAVDYCFVLREDSQQPKAWFDFVKF